MNGGNKRHVLGTRLLAKHLEAERWNDRDSPVVAFLVVAGFLALVVGFLWAAGP
jgi:hypothetical protein